MPFAIRILTVTVLCCGLVRPAVSTTGSQPTPGFSESAGDQQAIDLPACPQSGIAESSYQIWHVTDVSAWLNSEPQWLLTGWTVEASVDPPVEKEVVADSVPASQPNPAAVMGPPTSPDLPQYRLISRPAASQDATEVDGDSIEFTVSELFEPMNSVRVTGTSSIPPTLADDAEVSDLTAPADQAGLYMEESVRAVYFTRGYGVRRAPRNTWRFYCHPLYYEDVNLERCGRSKGCCTTACSALHFASRAAITPYLMTLQHHDDCVCMLPDCPTCHKFGCDATCPKWSWKAAFVQGAAVTGLVYAIP